MQKNSVNLVQIVGRLGQKPELKYSGAGLAIVNISLATNSVRRDKTSDENIESTEWHKVVVFGKTAEFLANYIDKGSILAVQGELKTSSWDHKTYPEVKMYKTEIVAFNVTPIGGKPQGGGSNASGGGSVPQGGNPFGGGGEDDEPLPF